MLQQRNKHILQRNYSTSQARNLQHQDHHQRPTLLPLRSIVHHVYKTLRVRPRPTSGHSLQHQRFNHKHPYYRPPRQLRTQQHTTTSNLHQAKLLQPREVKVRGFNKMHQHTLHQAITTSTRQTSHPSKQRSTKSIQHLRPPTATQQHLCPQHHTFRGLLIQPFTTSNITSPTRSTKQQQRHLRHLQITTHTPRPFKQRTLLYTSYSTPCLYLSPFILSCDLLPVLKHGWGGNQFF